MSVAIAVGVLADLHARYPRGVPAFKKAMDKVNRVLEAEGYLPHHEPERLPELHTRAYATSFPCAFLHHLRRFAAHAQARPQWQPAPFPADADPAEDPLVIDELAMLTSHLLCHADNEGFYVPVEFPDPLFAAQKLIPGGMLGSSQWLQRELVEVAPPLGIRLSRKQLTNAEAQRLHGLIEQETPFWRELIAWLALFEAARLSLAHRTASCFQ